MPYVDWLPLEVIVFDWLKENYRFEMGVVNEQGGLMDVVVTVPLKFGLEEWIAEGDPAGCAPGQGRNGTFTIGSEPKIKPGEPAST